MGKYPVELNEEMEPVRALRPVRLSLDWQLQPLSSARMTLADEEPPRPGSWFRLSMPDGTGAIFRTERVTRSPGGACEVWLSHGLVSLRDELLRTEYTTGLDLEGVLSGLLSHQQRVLWRVGDAPGETPCSWRFPRGNLLRAVLGLRDAAAEMQWQFDQNSLPWRLSLRETEDACELRPGRNLRTWQVTEDRTELCTCLLPLGRDGMTIAGVNGGSELLISPRAAEFGLVTRIYRDEEAVDPAALMLRAQRELARRETPVLRIEADALDLYGRTGEEADRLRPGALCRLPLRELGVDYTERIQRLRYPDLMQRPDEVQVTLCTRGQDMVRAFNDRGRVE